MSESAYRQLVADLATDGHSAGRTKRDIREEIVHLVHVAYATGEPWALEVMERWQREGAERDYESAHTALNTTTYIRRDGKRVKKTTSYSTPVRTSDSGEIAYVQQSFWDYERAPFVGKRNEMAAQGARIADVVAAMDLVIAAWDRHPDAQTARDAWTADGRSLDEIDLNEDAA